MQFHKQALLLLVALTASTTAFVVPSARGSAFGINTRSCSAVFSEATDDASAPAAPVAAAPVVAEEKFTIYVSNVPFSKCYLGLLSIASLLLI